MKFSDVYSICLDAINDLMNSIKDFKTSEKGYIKWNGWDPAWSILKYIKSIPIFSNLIADIESIAGAPAHINILSIPEQITLERFNMFSVGINKVINIMQVIILYGDSEEIKVLPDEFCIKLPNDVTLADLSYIIDALQKIFFNCPYLNQKGDEVQFKSVDTGTNWLVFAAISNMAISLLKRIGDLVHTAYKLREERLKQKYHMEYLQQMSMGTDVMNILTKNFEKAFNATTDKLCSGLQLENVLLTPEDVANTQMYVKMMADLLDKGIEVFASLKAPVEIRSIFPDFEQSKLSMEEFKLLESSTNATRNSENKSK